MRDLPLKGTPLSDHMCALLFGRKKGKKPKGTPLITCARSFFWYRGREGGRKGGWGTERGQQESVGVRVWALGSGRDQRCGIRALGVTNSGCRLLDGLHPYQL
jgi:hypothetical protein